MATKNSKTECSALDWEQFLLLVDRMKKSDDYRFLLLMAVGCYCGMRLSDMLQLKWGDILNKDYFEVIERKTGKHRKITINTALQELIDFCFKKLDAKKPVEIAHFIFINRSGNILSKQFVNRRLHAIFLKYRVKVQNGSSHTLRKTFGKRVYQMNNCSESALVLLSSIFNHNSISVTRRYIGLSQEQISDVYINL
jgi:integrase